MAQSRQINTRKETKNIFSDSKGNVILEIGQAQYAFRTSQGELIHRNINESIQLECGTMWSPLLLFAKPPVYIAVCELCRERNPKSSGLVSLHRSRICSKCGRTVCSKHRKLRDKKWMCLPCAKKHTIITKLIMPIFFKKIED